MQTEKKEEKVKQVWTRPEVIELDYEETKVGKIPDVGEFSNAGRDYGVS